MSQFPVYILDDNTILFPPDKSNLSHSKFWRESVVAVVAEKLGLSPSKLRNLPYCQRRGRVVGDRFYYGERLTKSLRSRIERAVGFELLVIEDDHERRLEYDVAKMRGMK